MLEALIKIVAFGFIKNGNSSYLRNPWNVLDFTLMIISIVQETLSISGAMSTLKVIRLLRILRPVRLIAKNQSLRVALASLLYSLPQIMKLQLLTSFMVFMIAIV